MKKTVLTRKTCFTAALAAVLIAVSSSNAFAQCEPPGIANAAAAGAAGSLAGALTAQYATLVATSEATVLASLQTPIATSLEVMDTMVFNRMGKFWEDWNQALRDMTGQLSAGTLDQTRQMASVADVQNVVNPARELQKAEYEAKKTYQTSEQSCTYDTAAVYGSSATRRSTGLASALTSDMTNLGTNKKGTAAAQGPAALGKSRWDTYVKTFCDPNANAKAAGCTAAGSNVNGDIQPSKTMFLRDTIDMSDEKTATSVRELVYNLTDYRVPEPMKGSVLKTPEGREQRQINREYLTQMDSVSGMVNAMVSERAPGMKAEEIQALRMKMGVPACPATGVPSGACASATPSEKEIRQAKIEELRDPNYYVQLNDSGVTTLQKEVMLRAFNLSMLYKLIEKSEKISNIYASETGNMLQAVDNSRSNGNQYRPIR